MSASSTRRLKDRNDVAASAAQKPTKIPTPISSICALKKLVSGKENSTPSLGAQLPAIRPVPRFDKAVAGSGEGRARWSISSVPRGRSQSPTEFVRIFRDARGECENRAVSAGKKSRRRSFTDCKENGGFGVGLVKKRGTSEPSDMKSKGKLSGLRISKGNCDKGDKSNPNAMRRSGFDANLVSKFPNGVKFDKVCVEKSGSDCSKAKVFRNLIEKGSSEDGSGNRVGLKYPSKIHEKLAFLEGKVKRIATDIRRTKEMLDMNNPAASKLVLSDIQDKISGIETAVGLVPADSSKNGGSDCEGSTLVDRFEDKVGDGAKSLIKELNSEELEARLLPHQKLFRNRTKLNSSLQSSRSHDEANAVESCAELKAEKKLSSPIKDSPLAPEFLASLGTEGILGDANADLRSSEVEAMDESATSGKQSSSDTFTGKCEEELFLRTDETLDELNNQGSRTTAVGGRAEDTYVHPVNIIGAQSSTGGWFVSEGESVLLAHDDGSCSFYDIANCEEKAVYKSPAGCSPNIWRDCWIIRAPRADGCSGRYVVAASAGNTPDSGFCSWDFYTKDVQAFHAENGGLTASRTVLDPLPNDMYRKSTLSGTLLLENRQWWYKPCGPLIISTASNQKMIKIHDIRDGEQIMKWAVHKPVTAMDYSSPLQWRNKGKVVVAEAETISLWDVNSITPLSLSSISLSGQKIYALHVNNTDAELGGGVRQRVHSAEVEGNDGVFCTLDSVNVLDFRHPSGIGLKIPTSNVNVQSVFTQGDLVYIGCTNLQSCGKTHSGTQVQQFSLRKQKLISTYSLPESNAHSHQSAITQVWGNSNLVMGVCSLGLFVFDALKDDAAVGHGNVQKVKDVIGPDDMFSPSFDYLASHVLLVSRDRPALWKLI